MGALYSMQGLHGVLEVYEDRVTISPKGLKGLLVKGIKGTKEIPFTSITAIQFKKADFFFRGFLQFTISGGEESKRGILATAADLAGGVGSVLSRSPMGKDPNTFMFTHGWPFSDNNSKARKIKEHISLAMRKPRSPQAPAPAASLSDELQTLVRLKQQGMLSEEEFQSAKKKLIG
jgi:hypothetical protein